MDSVLSIKWDRLGAVFTGAKMVGWAVNLVTIALVAIAVWKLAPTLADLQDGQQQQLLGQALDGRPTLIVLFQEADCTSWWAFVAEWRRVMRDGAVDVLAVPVNAPDQESLQRLQQRLPQNMGFRPELAALAVRMLNDVSAGQTPSALLVDGRGRPRLVLHAWEVSKNQLDVQAAVISYARMMRTQ